MELTAVAYMAHSVWVAMCPRPGCMNAEMFGRCDDGTVGGLEASRFTCRVDGHRPDGSRVVYRGCGLRCGVEWPPDIADLERVLLARPAPSTRNWRPGESLEDLVAENFAHGLVPTAAVERGRFDVVDGQVAHGGLEFTTARELGGAV